MSRRLQQEIRQEKPFTALEEVVFLNLLKTAEALAAGEVAVLKEEGLTFAQYNVLRILRGAGKAGIACSDIAARMVNRDPDVTRLLDRLERRGFVERSRHPADRRMVIARITRPALDLLQRLDEPVLRVHRDQLSHMTSAELATLSDLLERARAPGSAEAASEGR